MFRTDFPLLTLNGHLDRALRDAIRPRAEKERRFVPPVDVREEADRMILVADLPGVRPEDVRLEFENGVLTLSGERKDDTEGKTATYHRYERTHGAFERRFALPAEVYGDGIDASYDAGVLTIVLPKRPEAKKRTIDIRRK